MASPFEIDTFEYDAYVNYDQADGVAAFALDYQYWGERLQPLFAITEGSCKANQCTFTGRNPTITFAKSAKDKGNAYKFKIHLPHPKGPVISRWWLTLGYPETAGTPQSIRRLSRG